MRDRARGSTPSRRVSRLHAQGAAPIPRRSADQLRQDEGADSPWYFEPVRTHSRAPPEPLAWTEYHLVRESVLRSRQALRRILRSLWNGGGFVHRGAVEQAGTLPQPLGQLRFDPR